MSKKKLYFHKKLQDYSLYWDQLQNSVKNFCEENGLDESSISIQAEYDRGYYDSIDLSLQLVANRPETDEEYATRLDKEKAAKQAEAVVARNAAERRKKNELALYLRLQKKYGNTVETQVEPRDNEVWDGK